MNARVRKSKGSSQLESFLQKLEEESTTNRSRRAIITNGIHLKVNSLALWAGLTKAEHAATRRARKKRIRAMVLLLMCR